MVYAGDGSAHCVCDFDGEYKYTVVQCECHCEGHHGGKVSWSFECDTEMTMRNS